MSTLCEFSGDFSTLLRQKHIDEEEKFGRKIHSLVNLVSSFQMALKQRKSIQVQYTATNKQIIDKGTAIDKAFNHLKPPEITDKLKEERAELDKQSEVEKKVLEECTERLLRDSESYKPRLEILLKESFLQYAKIQMSYTNRISHAFGQLIPYLDDGMKGEGGYVPTSTPVTTTEAPPAAAAAAAVAAELPASASPPVPVEEGTTKDSYDTSVVVDDDIDVEDLDDEDANSTG